jgi:hypothetical protein
VATILGNPRYIGWQVWNRQRTDHGGGVSGGKRAGQWWNPPAGWMISKAIAHPALVSEDDFIAAHAIDATPIPTDGVTRGYALVGLVVCRVCGQTATTGTAGAPLARCWAAPVEIPLPRRWSAPELDRASSSTDSRAYPSCLSVGAGTRRFVDFRRRAGCFGHVAQQPRSVAIVSLVVNQAGGRWVSWLSRTDSTRVLRSLPGR